MYCEKCGIETNDDARFCKICKAKLQQRQKVVDNYFAKAGVPSAREHHAYILVYLVGIIIFTSIKIINIPVSIATTNAIKQAIADGEAVGAGYLYIVPDWSTWVGLGLSIALIGFAIAVFKWKWWGIAGFIAITITNFVVDMIAIPGKMVVLNEWALAPTAVARAATIITIFVVVIGVFLAVLWVDRGSGWSQKN